MEEFNFSDGEAIDAPGIYTKESKAGKIFEFVAPSTKQIAEGAMEGKMPTARQTIGMGLELGSIFLPVGATAKALGLVGKAGYRTVQAVKMAQRMKKLGRETRVAVGVGGVAGGMFGAAQEVADEDSSLKEIAGGAAIGATGGMLGGAVIAPVTSFAVMGAKGVSNLTSGAFRQWSQRLQQPKVASEAIEHLTDSYMLSFNKDRPQITLGLQKIWTKAGNVGGPTDERGLFRELAQSGYIPKIEGKIARTKHIMDDVSDKIRHGMDEVQEVAGLIKKKTTVSTFKARVQNELKQDLRIDLDKSLRESESIFKGIQTKYGARIDAKAINNIRIELNKQTKAYGKEIFAEDTKDAIARVSRTFLDELADELAPEQQIIKRMNREIAKFGRMRNVSKLLDGKTISSGEYVDSLGRFTGTVGASAAGLTLAGPGGLVIAGIAAQVGSKTVAAWIRRFRFNSTIQKAVIQGISQDEKLLQKLIREATPADAKVIKNVVKVSEVVRNIGKIPGQ